MIFFHIDIPFANRLLLMTIKTAAKMTAATAAITPPERAA